MVISTRNGQAKGSARSVAGIDLTAALSRCADLLDRFGGHPMAAGISLKASRIDAFGERLDSALDRLPTSEEAAVLSIDGALPLSELTPDLMDSIERLGPFGQANPHPLLMASGIRVKASQRVGERHRRMQLASQAGGGPTLAAIQFNADDAPPGDRFEKIAYRPQWNHWNGRREMQLVIEAIDPD